MANKQIKSFSVSVVIREMQVKMTGTATYLLEW